RPRVTRRKSKGAGPVPCSACGPSMLGAQTIWMDQVSCPSRMLALKREHGSEDRVRYQLITSDHGDQLAKVDRLDQVVVKPGVLRAASVFSLTIAAHGHQPNIGQCRLAPQRLGHT